MQQKTLNTLIDELTNIVGTDHCLFDEPMKKHTSMRIGGPATFYCIVETKKELCGIIDFCRREQVKYFIIGNGTNIVVPDDGYDGVVIRLSGEFNTISIKDDINSGTALFTVGAGVPLTQVAIKAMHKGFTGFEFAHGIPGSVGGAVYMNAGAYGGSISQVLMTVEVLSKDGKIKNLPASELKLSYRHSALMETGDIVLSAKFRLKVYPRIMIRTLMVSLKKQRQTKQPLEYASAGSTFKRPEGYFAGRLIEDAGLKGYQVGGCQVSEKHAGFVVNLGNATCEDFNQITNDIIEKVREKSGVTLELEVKYME